MVGGWVRRGGMGRVGEEGREREGWVGEEGRDGAGG